MAMGERKRSGKRVVVVGLLLSVAVAAVIVALFARYGLGNFTRAARIVEARSRAFELASGIARCTARGDGALPESAPLAPSALEPKAWFDEARSAKTFDAPAHLCAGFRPRGELHVRVAWRREGPVAGAVTAHLDDDADGRDEFVATSRVECAPGGEERCRASMPTETHLPR